MFSTSLYQEAAIGILPAPLFLTPSQYLSDFWHSTLNNAALPFCSESGMVWKGWQLLGPLCAPARLRVAPHRPRA